MTPRRPGPDESSRPATVWRTGRSTDLRMTLTAARELVAWYIPAHSQRACWMSGP